MCMWQTRRAKVDTGPASRPQDQATRSLELSQSASVGRAVQRSSSSRASRSFLHRPDEGECSGRQVALGSAGIWQVAGAR